MILSGFGAKHRTYGCNNHRAISSGCHYLHSNLLLIHSLMTTRVYAAYAFEAIWSKLSKKKKIAFEKYHNLESQSGISQISSEVLLDRCPLFVTWNTVDKKGHHLRGCIGTFSEVDLPEGIEKYALIAAFQDTRFYPVSAEELPTLSCTVTLLWGFEDIEDPTDWIVGTHGVEAHFQSKTRGSVFKSTFLPEVAEEFGWDQEETLEQLAAKAGARGSLEQYHIQVTRYQGSQSTIEYEEWQELRSRLLHSSK